jgi:hypothetical protein
MSVKKTQKQELREKARAILRELTIKIMDDGYAMIECGTPESAALLELVHRKDT